MRSDVPSSKELMVLQFVASIVTRCRAQFPRSCPTCAKRYETYADFVATTSVISTPMQFDTSEDDPIGILAFANCGECGSTLSVRWEGKPGPERLAFRAALRDDLQRTGLAEQDLFALVQSQTRRG